MAPHRDDAAWRRAILAELPAIDGRRHRLLWALGALRFARPDVARRAPLLCPVLPALLTALYVQQGLKALFNREILLGMGVVWAAVTVLGLLVRARPVPAARAAVCTILLAGFPFLALDIDHLTSGVGEGLISPAGAGVALAGMTALTVVLPLLPFLAVLLAAPVVAGTGLRKGSANSARGAARLIADTLVVAKTAGADPRTRGQGAAAGRHRLLHHRRRRCGPQGPGAVLDRRPDDRHREEGRYEHPR